MEFDIADEAFRREGATWLQSLNTAALTDLQAVFRLSPGYYPTTLIELWRDELARRALSEPPTSTTPQATRYAMPVCHPGDYEWRFTDETAAILLERVTEGLRSGARVAHLGAPTTFVLGRDRYAGFRHVLVDRNPCVASVTPGDDDVCRVDLMNVLPPVLGAQAAVVDPPWYPADTHAFLVATSRVCVLGARIVMCQPTRATRPGVTKERAALLGLLPQLGFVCQSADAACVRYRMPHFEAASLKAAVPGLVVPGDWRAGDLLTLEKVAETVPQLSAAEPAEQWQEVMFGPVRVKLRRTRPPDIGSLVRGDVLQNVSRRDPVRQHIGMWTSGNRIYTLTHPDEIGNLISLCHSDVMQLRFTLSRSLAHARSLGVSRRVGRRLFDVLLTELQEHALQRKA